MKNIFERSSFSTWGRITRTKEKFCLKPRGWMVDRSMGCVIRGWRFPDLIDFPAIDH